MDRFAGGSGYNQEDCKLKACISVEEMLRRGKQLTEKAEEQARKTQRKDCPVDKDELGRSTWNLLHTMSVAYPEKPTPQDAKVAGDFLQNLSKTYPCSYCASDLRKDLESHPPDLKDKKSFAQWMCEMHNRVNDKLGKDAFDCSKVFERAIMAMAAFFNMARKDVDIPKNASKELFKNLHSDYIAKYQSKKDSYEFITTEYLRMSGIYWCLTAMDLLGDLDKIAKDEVIQFVKECQKEDGGFACAPKHDAHVLYTLSAIQIAVTYDFIDELDVENTVKFVKSRQNEDGSFGGDRYNEIDTRFTFCSLAALYLLDKLDAVDVDKAIEFVLKCHNPDGGFGTRPGSESHAGQVYCCVGSLAVTGRLSKIEKDRTAEWLAQRQCPSGGLNGRPDKLPDVCYSWWDLASLAILGRLDWIDKDSMVRFILACQDAETGGIADRPGDVSDPFHTLFGLAGLSLLGFGELQQIDAVFCMTKKVLEKKSLC